MPEGDRAYTLPSQSSSPSSPHHLPVLRLPRLQAYLFASCFRKSLLRSVSSSLLSLSSSSAPPIFLLSFLVCIAIQLCLFPPHCHLPLPRPSPTLLLHPIKRVHGLSTFLKWLSANKKVPLRQYVTPLPCLNK